MPVPATYRVVASPGRLRIGPVIGILAGRSPGDLSRRRLNLLANHLLEQEEGGGLFYVFDRASVDRTRQLIRGFRLADTGPRAWAPGDFPFPDVVFCRYGVTPGTTGRHLELAGVKVFNQPFHKGEAARWLSGCEVVAPHVPETVELPSRPGAAGPLVQSMVKKYPVVFIKPRWGSQGKGILRIRRMTNGFVVERVGGPAVTCPCAASLLQTLTPIWPKAAIIQQGVEVAGVGGRVIDFRVIVQRDGTGDWQVTAIFARIGGAGQFVTNVDPGGIPVPFSEAARYLFGDDPRERFLRRQQLVRPALAVGAAMDRSGWLVADLGLGPQPQHRLGSRIVGRLFSLPHPAVGVCRAGRRVCRRYRPGLMGDGM